MNDVMFSIVGNGRMFRFHSSSTRPARIGLESVDVSRFGTISYRLQGRYVKDNFIEIRNITGEMNATT